MKWLRRYLDQKDPTLREFANLCGVLSSPDLMTAVEATHGARWSAGLEQTPESSLRELQSEERHRGDSPEEHNRGKERYPPGSELQAPRRH